MNSWPVPTTESVEDLEAPVGFVLVVEDDRDLREILATFLRTKKWAVIALESGPDALELTRNAHFDAVVLDIRSPSTGGLGVLQSLRANDPTLPVIVITSFGDSFLSQCAQRMGATRILEKPFDLDVLERAIDETTPRPTIE